MPSHYTVIQYVPDPISDERINVGVIAIGDGGAHVRFLQHWARVKDFAATDVKFLKQFARDVQDRQLVLGEAPNAWTVEHLRRYAAEWRHSLQFSEPRGSLKPAVELIEEIARRFLVDEIGPAYGYRTRTDVISIGARAARAALRERLGGRAGGLLKTRYPLEGLRATHHFDLVAANGQPIFAAQALSLEVPDARHVEKDINAAGWSLHDLRNQQPDFPTAILAMMPPAEGPVVDAAVQSNIKRVRAVADELAIPLHTDPVGFQAWAAQQAEDLE